MILLVLLGNFLAVILICCGVAASYETISLAEKSMGLFPFLKLISADLMPAFAGVVLLALIQACRLLEELLYSQAQPAPEEVAPKKSRKRAAIPQNSNYFGEAAQEVAPAAAYTPAPPPLPQHPSHAAATPAPSKSQAPQQDKKLSFFHVD